MKLFPAVFDHSFLDADTLGDRRAGGENTRADRRQQQGLGNRSQERILALLGASDHEVDQVGRRRLDHRINVCRRAGIGVDEIADVDQAFVRVD